MADIVLLYKDHLTTPSVDIHNIRDEAFPLIPLFLITVLVPFKDLP